MHQRTRPKRRVQAIQKPVARTHTHTHIHPLNSTAHLPPIHPRQNNNKPVRQIPRVQSMMIPADFLPPPTAVVQLRGREGRLDREVGENAWFESRTREDRFAWTDRGSNRSRGVWHCIPISLIAQSTLARRGSH